MAIPEFVKITVEKKLKNYCDHKIPEHIRNEIKLSYNFFGNTIFLIESRPAYLGDGWAEMKIAKFKFDQKSGTWELFCADRNGRWHSYSTTGQIKNFQLLLDAVEEDVTGIFWG